jgi:hypothetical protein
MPKENNSTTMSKNQSSLRVIQRKKTNQTIIKINICQGNNDAFKKKKLFSSLEHYIFTSSYFIVAFILCLLFASS